MRTKRIVLAGWLLGAAIVFTASPAGADNEPKPPCRVMATLYFEYWELNDVPIYKGISDGSIQCPSNDDLRTVIGAKISWIAYDYKSGYPQGKSDANANICEGDYCHVRVQGDATLNNCFVASAVGVAFGNRSPSEPATINNFDTCDIYLI